ncbi:FimV/HubP family polar landmark protein, partial [Vibrio aerogenes]
MRQFFNPLLLSVLITVVTHISFVSAESIRLVGPTGEVRSSPQLSGIVKADSLPESSTGEPSSLYGPTSGKETLWSIASKLRPSNQVTVQQTLLAIYQLNPQSFELQNIHKLIPGSMLRVPSLAQVSRLKKDEAMRVMAEHQRRLNGVVGQPQSPVRTVSAPADSAESSPRSSRINIQRQPEAQKPTSDPKIDKQVVSVPEAVSKITEAPKADQSPEEKLPVLSLAQTETASSGSELQALEEKNHHLTMMLSKVQTEVTDLKSELGDKDKIRSEVEKLLAAERKKRDEKLRLDPTPLDLLLANGWLVAALTLIPGGLIAFALAMFLGRRSSAAEDESTNLSPATAEVDDEAVSIGEANMEDSGEELDELMLDDDLFSGGADKDEDDESEIDENDVFAELEDVDLDLDDDSEEDLFAGIDDDGDLVDTDLDDLSSGSSDISVNGEDKAVGLEEMEKALDDASLSSDLDDDFDLSDSGDAISQDEIETLLDEDGPSEELGADSVDQGMLDDLLSDTEMDDFLDEEPSSEHDDLDNDLDLLLNEDSDDQSAIDFLDSEEESTELLDELLEEEDVVTDLSDESTELLDELIDENSEVAQKSEPMDWDQELDELTGDDTPDEDIDFSGADTLDELLEESELPAGSDFEEDSADLLDEFIDADDSSATDDIVDFDTQDDVDDLLEESPIDDGTELFDELLEIERDTENSNLDDEDFNREDFIDDLISSAPDADPLLDETGPEDEKAESGDNLKQRESVVENEFGIPQDSDWLVDEDEEESGDDSGFELPDFDEAEALAEVEDLSDFLDETVHPESDIEQEPTQAKSHTANDDLDLSDSDKSTDTLAGETENLDLPTESAADEWSDELSDDEFESKITESDADLLDELDDLDVSDLDDLTTELEDESVTEPESAQAEAELTETEAEEEIAQESDADLFDELDDLDVSDLDDLTTELEDESVIEPESEQAEAELTETEAEEEIAQESDADLF